MRSRPMLLGKAFKQSAVGAKTDNTTRFVVIVVEFL